MQIHTSMLKCRRGRPRSLVLERRERVRWVLAIFVGGLLVNNFRALVTLTGEHDAAISDAPAPAKGGSRGRSARQSESRSARRRRSSKKTMEAEKIQTERVLEQKRHELEAEIKMTETAERTAGERIKRESADSMQDRSASATAVAVPKSRNIQRLRQLENELGDLFGRNVTACRKGGERNGNCDAYFDDNYVNKNISLVIYNPTARDKFLCGDRFILGPKKWTSLDGFENCGNSLAETAHSFPYPPTFENRGAFPGIGAERKTKAHDDTFSGGRFKNIKFSHECDVNCDHDRSNNGIHRQVKIYGTDWSFEWSGEGAGYYSSLKVKDEAWQQNKFYATTSFKSEVPLSYYSFIPGTYNNEIRGVNGTVPFGSGIKGAVFLARNCGSKNKREDKVRGLMASGFRVDSLSSCLKNGNPPPGVNLRNKRQIMSKYLFYLAFENQATEDYITEKLWGPLAAGTIPVYFGAPNIKEHIGDLNAVIFVDDFADMKELGAYLTKVSQDESLYNSYHEWREKPYPQSFLKKYNITWISDKCRVCRWAHARKYGLGWNHGDQKIESTTLPRESCVDGLLHGPTARPWWSFWSSGSRLLQSGLLTSPVSESWHSYVDRKNFPGKLLEPTEVKPVGNHSGCPLIGEHLVKVGPDLTRKVWHHDGNTDILVEGKSSNRHVLRLQLPFTGRKPLKSVDSSYTVWIQNDVSRISLVFYQLDDTLSQPMIVTRSGYVDIEIKPGSLPLRIRIIVEDLDLFHKDAVEFESFYGKNMAEDVYNRPEVFALT